MIYCIIIQDGEDYVGGSVSFTIQNAENRACLNISIIDDSVFENIEDFQVTLTIDSPPPELSLTTTVANVSITDNDGQYKPFSIA